MAGGTRISNILRHNQILQIPGITRLNNRIKIQDQNERLLVSLRRDRFANALSDTTRHILNLSDYDLSDTESFVLSHGLNFGLPHRYLCKQEIIADFESGHSFYITVSFLLNNALL